MISNDPNAPSLQTSDNSAVAGAPVLADPRLPIEVSTGGNGTVNDPAASDTKPPGIDMADLDLLV